MAAPWECRAIPDSIGVGLDGLCAGPEAVPEVAPDVVAAAAAPAAPGEVVAGAPAVPQVTDLMVLEALRTIGLPASRLQVQPPNGRTLVNFETNFFTEATALAPVLTLLGQTVELQVRPAGYSWVFGDGESTTTTGPGRPFPALDVTHRYTGAGEVAARVDVTYVADYRVEGGQWAPVPGSVTVAGTPVALEVVEASPLLVG